MIQQKLIKALDKINFGKFGKIKYLIQKIIRGWDDSDTWNLDVTVSKFMLPRLKRYRELGINTIPSDKLTIEDWNRILDEIEWFLEVHANFSCPWDEEGMKRYKKAGKYFGKYFGALWD